MEITITQALLLAIIVGLSQVVKKIGLNDKFIPLFTILAGWILCFAIKMPFPELLLGGLILGLGAVGLFSGTKNTIQGIKGK